MTSVCVTLATWLPGVAAAAAAAPPEALDLSVLRAIPVQHDGRWPPLDTVARDHVETVTGTEFFEGRDPVWTLLAWTFDPLHWRDAPLIRIRSAPLRRQLELSESETVYSYNALTSSRRIHAMIDELSALPGDVKPDPLQKKLKSVHKKLLALNAIFSGKALSLVPHPSDPLGSWSTVFEAAAGETHDVAAAWTALGESFLGGDPAAFASAARHLAVTLESLPAAYRPTRRLLATELHANALAPFTRAWQLTLIAALVSLVAAWVRRRWLDALTVAAMLGGFGMLTYGLWLRWQIAGRVPASNMYESLLFLGWGMGAFTVISLLLVRQRIVSLTAAVMGTTALLLADCLPMDHFVRPIAPVLMDTVWMAIHVPIIMTSYAVLALGVLIAHIQLAATAVAPARRGLIASLESLHYWYVHVGSVLLMGGLVTGSMWAASSWGRYWGWDPKEVWSLVALLGYLTILHVRISRERLPRWAYAVGIALVVGILVIIAAPFGSPRLAVLIPLAGVGLVMGLLLLPHGPLATPTKSVLAFWMIIMTYVGVNYVLGTGLHSYGFGSGGVVRSMVIAAGLDLAVILACCTIHLARRRGQGLTPGTCPS